MIESEQLTEKLLQLEQSKDRGKMSHLRRWWSPATKHYAYPVIAGLAGGYSIDHPPTCIVAALFAVHPAHSEKSKNFGTTCRLVAGKHKDTFDSHFYRLLASEDLLNDLAPILYRIAKRAKKDGIAINFTQLHKDLCKWKYSAERIKTDWAKEYYCVPDSSKLDIPTS